MYSKYSVITTVYRPELGLVRYHPDPQYVLMTGILVILLVSRSEVSLDVILT